jgi:hypothetical protein
MDIPPGSEGKVCKLRKYVIGVKQSPVACLEGLQTKFVVWDMDKQC